MNQRIRPDELSRPPYASWIQILADQWRRTVMPASGLTRPDYERTIGTLLLTTQAPARTADIVQAVLTQAVTRGRSSAWVEQELKFEGMIEGADRADFLLFDLHQSGQPDDTQLDLYNERIHRFTAQDC